MPTSTSTSKSSSTAPSARGGSGRAPTRLPSTRERRPALAALGVLLIVGGALASAWLALRVSDRADYLALRDSVAQGESIEQADLRTVSLPNDVAGAIPEEDIGQVTGRFAAAPLVPGSILVQPMLTDRPGAPDGQVETSGGFNPETVPDSVTNGSPIFVVLPSPDDGVESAGAVPATVASIERPSTDEEGLSSGSDVTTVSFFVTADCFNAVALAAKADELGLGTGSTVEDSGHRLAGCASGGG